MVFEPSDLLIVGTLIILEGLLSADNALVLALLVRHLPDEQQKKALVYGLVGAFTLRSIGIYFARFIISLWWLCAIGAAYLMFLAVKHFIAQRGAHGEEDPKGTVDKARGMGFWQTVALVEFTDIVFAVDSILVAVALVNDPKKLWIVYTGGFLGIVLLRMAAGFFIGLIRKYPTLDNMAYALVGWAGVKLASASVDIYYHSRGMDEVHLLPKTAFWIGFALILIVGIWSAMRHKKTPEDFDDDAAAQEALECLEDGGFIPDRTPPPGPSESDRFSPPRSSGNGTAPSSPETPTDTPEAEGQENTKESVETRR